MTSEEKLKAIIEAQVKGGCGENKAILKMIDIPLYFYQGSLLLSILLDEKGLKAAYGLHFRKIAHTILDGWLLSGWETAIQDAYSLLPQKDA